MFSVASMPSFDANMVLEWLIYVVLFAFFSHQYSVNTTHMHCLTFLFQYQYRAKITHKLYIAALFKHQYGAKITRTHYPIALFQHQYGAKIDRIRCLIYPF